MKHNEANDGSLGALSSYPQELLNASTYIKAERTGTTIAEGYPSNMHNTDGLVSIQ